MKQQRHKFLQDDDGHTYLIPLVLEDDFQDFVYNGGEDKGFSEMMLGVHPSRYSFTNPQDEG